MIRRAREEGRSSQDQVQVQGGKTTAGSAALDGGGSRGETLGESGAQQGKEWGVAESEG